MDRNYSCKVHGYFNSTVIKGDVPCPWCERDAVRVEIEQLRNQCSNMETAIRKYVNSDGWVPYETLIQALPTGGSSDGG